MVVDSVISNKVRKLKYCYVKEMLTFLQPHFIWVLKLGSLSLFPVVEGKNFL